MLKGNEKFGGYKATFSVLENNLFNCFAKMVTYTLFKKQTDNMIQKCQHQILICVNSEIIKYGKKSYIWKSATDYVRSRANDGFCSLQSV